mmetsp:Transcript_119329/g.380495  ORF Transcript_119329/g.380495 Transcript_119329/m.380495 type:complete len:206 (+) Transcript_119329:1574-2191(+)
MDLADRCRANRLCVKLHEHLVQWHAQFSFNYCLDTAERQCRRIIPQYLESLNVFRRYGIRVLRQELGGLHIEALLPENDVQRYRSVLGMQPSECFTLFLVAPPTCVHLHRLVVEGDGQDIIIELHCALEALVPTQDKYSCRADSNTNRQRCANRAAALSTTMTERCGCRCNPCPRTAAHRASGSDSGHVSGEEGVLKTFSDTSLG